MLFLTLPEVMESKLVLAWLWARAPAGSPLGRAVVNGMAMPTPKIILRFSKPNKFSISKRPCVPKGLSCLNRVKLWSSALFSFFFVFCIYYLLARSLAVWGVSKHRGKDEVETTGPTRSEDSNCFPEIAWGHLSEGKIKWCALVLVDKGTFSYDEGSCF